MFSSVRANSMRVAKRNFSSTVSRMGHGPDGPYSNLPFKVHNRKIPYVVIHWTFFIVGFSTPFAITYYNLKKAGNL